MSSASLLGSARSSIGRAGHSSIQSFLTQGPCTFVSDRDDERASFSHIAVAGSSDGVSCSFSGYRSSSRIARCGLLCDSSLAHRSTSYCTDTSSGLSSSAVSLGKDVRSSVGDACSGLSLLSSRVYQSPTPCPSRKCMTARVLGLHSSMSDSFARCLKVHRGVGSVPGTKTRSEGINRSPRGRRSIRAMAVRSEERTRSPSRSDSRATDDLTAKRTSNQYLRNIESESDAKWEQLNMITRVVSSLAMYGSLVLASNALCKFIGVDCWGGFKPSIETFVQAVGWAIPPMMALLLILEDEVVKICPPARAIRDVEDEELMDFFVGMNPLQFIFVVAAGSLSEELFFRVAIQGGLAHALQCTAKGADEMVIGVSTLTTIIPFFAPFAQAFAAVLTASLTGSMYYVMSSPKDPTYVIASGNKSLPNNKRDMKKRVEAWSESRQMKKIYSPLMEALLALYLGFEWVQTGNIFGPMITHTLYSLVVGGNGLRRIHDNKFKLRQRVNEVTQPKVPNSDIVYLDHHN